MQNSSKGIVDLERLVTEANSPLTNPEMNRTVGATDARFELYHFALSLCSQKVRVCLAEKGASYVAHDINLQLPLLGNYDPAYVRLRMAANPDVEFATEYTGRSSVESEGFDPAVVPTLVDYETRQVVIDSLAICRHIDAAFEGTARLVPTDLEDGVLHELNIVDATPHVAIFYGAHPELDFRPEHIRNGMPGVHDRKIAKIRTARDLVPDDPDLIAAYDAKIAKEEAGKAHVLTPEKMHQSVVEILRIVEDLNSRLADGRTWICGNTFTLADVFWAVSLFRLKWLGMDFAWFGQHELNSNESPFVAAYGSRCFKRPAFRSAAIDWPGMPRSEYASDHYRAKDA
ncbi:MAG: glutathione S-transferase family protein [Boseongicola sp.]